MLVQVVRHNVVGYFVGRVQQTNAVVRFGLRRHQKRLALQVDDVIEVSDPRLDAAKSMVLVDVVEPATADELADSRLQQYEVKERIDLQEETNPYSDVE